MKKILVCGPRPPAFDRESGARRLHDLIGILVDLGHSVTFLAQHDPIEPRYTFTLERLGVHVLIGSRTDCPEVIRAGKFDIAVLSFWYVAETYMPLLRQCSPATRVLVDSVDLHFLRETREHLANDAQHRGLPDDAGARMARELSVYAGADAVLTVSDVERAFLTAMVGSATHIVTIPDMEETPPSPLSFHERKDFLFVGNFWHRPNVDAIRYLGAEIVPRLRSETLRQHRFNIVGNAASNLVATPAVALPAMNLVGWLPSLRGYLACAKLSVAPLRFGAGTKRKVLQSLAAGTPVVSTSVGVEGLDLHAGEQVLVADSPEAFAHALERLASDELLWNTLAANGRAYVNDFHSPTVVRSSLESALSVVVDQTSTVRVRSAGVLGEHRAALHRSLFDTDLVESRRPVIVRHSVPASAMRAAQLQRILVLGVYMTNTETNVDDIVTVLAQPAVHAFTQRWAALGGAPPTRAVASVTQLRIPRGTPKWQAVMEIMRPGDLESFDYIVVCDDDIVLPERFLETFIGLQAWADLSLAQPARAHGSYIDWPIVEKQEGCLVRQTRYVEGGPVVSFHRSAFGVVFPVDMASPMGWGYGNVWSKLAETHGLRTGIVDAVAVDHGLRRPVTGYSRSNAAAHRATLLQQREHNSYARCFTVLDVPSGRKASRTPRAAHGSRVEPLVSVVIATHNRADLLATCLESLATQSLPASRFETVVVDDGSTDSTRATVRRFAKSNVRYLRMDHAGKGAAKNLGLFASRGEIVHFFDDDDYADETMVERHLACHQRNPGNAVAVLGHTTWGSRVTVSPVMNFITEIGQNLFSYRSLNAGDKLGFSHFWEGRVSCKRAFLVNRAIHRQDLEYLVDIELGYRLAKHGLVVLYEPEVRSYMNRAITFAEFCARSESKGKAMHALWRLHGDDPQIAEYCTPDRHRTVADEFVATRENIIMRVEELERAHDRDPGSLKELHELYGRAFRGSLSRGFFAAQSGGGHRPPR